MDPLVLTHGRMKEFGSSLVAHLDESVACLSRVTSCWNGMLSLGRGVASVFRQFPFFQQKTRHNCQIKSGDTNSVF